MGSKVVTISIWELLHKILLTIPILEIVRSWNDNNFKKNNSNLAVEKNFGDDRHNFKFEIVTFTISNFEIVTTTISNFEIVSTFEIILYKI